MNSHSAGGSPYSLFQSESPNILLVFRVETKLREDIDENAE